MSIQLKNIHKTFGNFAALKGVDLEIRTGELIALLGPSGSGKTTLLRIIAGLEEADRRDDTHVSFDGEDVTRRHVGARQVGFVFQHYALFRHMTVAENVAFGLRVRPWKTRPRKRVIRERVMKLLGLVQLDSFAKRYPSQMSGGQRQRVALARALAVEPKVLLLDEPFGALDAKVRRELRKWLRELHDQTGITTVFVTHDQEEALEVSDRVAILNHGEIAQLGTPDEVYERPASPFVYNFLGNVNLFHGRASEHGLEIGDQRYDASGLKGGASADSIASPDGPDPVAATAYVRPHEIDLRRDDQSAGKLIRVKVKHVASAGPVVRVSTVRSDTGTAVEIDLPRDRYKELNPQIGEELFGELKQLRVFSEDNTLDYSI